jgi:hypothetical protein
MAYKNTFKIKIKTTSQNILPIRPRLMEQLILPFILINYTYFIFVVDLIYFK